MERQETRFAFNKVSRAWHYASRDAFSQVVVDGSQRAKRLALKLYRGRDRVSDSTQRISSILLVERTDYSDREGRRSKIHAVLIHLLPELASFTLSYSDYLGKEGDAMGPALRGAVRTLSKLRSFSLRSSSAHTDLWYSPEQMLK